MRLIKPSYAEMSDEALMRSMRNGDQRAFDEIYKRYSGPLLGYFMRMLWRDREKAEDFVHDLFAKIIRKPDYFDMERSFKTWIYSVANNMCKNEYRKAEVQNKVHDNLKVLTSSISFNDAETNTDYDVFMKELQNSLNQEDQIKKAAFMLKYFEDMPVKEISEILNIPEGTIKSGLHYTTKRLSKKLQHFKSI